MVQGFERREGVQDQNPQKAMQADSVPLSTVMYPRHASMEGVGKNWEELGALAGVLKKPLEEFVTRYKDQSTVEGEMMYAQGKAEQEVAEAGNAYTFQGFMNMKAKTESNMWFNNRMLAISEGDNEKDPDSYRKELGADLDGIMKAMSGADEATKKFVVNDAMNNMTKLVANHTKAHFSWKKDQTFVEYINLLGSEADRQNPGNPGEVDRTMDMLLDPEMAGLPEKDWKRAVGARMSLDFGAGKTKTLEAFMRKFGGDRTAELDGIVNSSRVPNVVSAILAVESGGRRYNADGSVVTNPKSGARGEFQVLPSTAKNPGFGIAPAKDDSPEEYARVGREYIDRLSEKYNNNPVLVAMAYHGGPGAVDAHIAKGDPRVNAVSWDKFVASFVDKRGDADATQQYLKKLSPYIQGEVPAKEAMKAGALIDSMVRAGFEPDQITQINNAYERMSKQKGNEFSEAKFKAEKSILDTAEADGNFDAGLKRIREIKEQMGLSDKWANSTANKLSTSIDTYVKKETQRQNIQYASSTNTLASLPTKEQEIGIQLQKAKDAGEVEAMVQQGKLDQDAAPQELFNRNIQFVHRQGIVDKKLSADVQAGMLAPFYDKAGAVSKETRTSFKKYLAIRELGGPEYAAQYAGDAKEILDLAYEYSSGENLDTALISAKTVLEKVGKEAIPQPKATDAEADRVTSKFLDNFDASYLLGRTFEDRNALGPAQVFDWEVDAAKNDPRLRAFVKQQYINERRKGFPESTVERKVRDTVNTQVDFVLGSPVITKPGESLNEVAGITTGERNAINKALQIYLQEVGPTVPAWKNDWNSFQLFGSYKPDDSFLTKATKTVTGIPNAAIESVKEKYRGVPMMHVQYDPQTKNLILRPYRDNERTDLIDAPLVVSVKKLGELHTVLNAPKNERNTVSEWASWFSDKAGAGFSAIGGKY